MNQISSTYKGLITGLLMLCVSLVIYYAKGSFENSLQYISYAIYVVGILWTLFAFKNGPSENKSFKNYFTEGFKCFIVITFVMVLFTLIFTKLHPELKEQMATTYRAGLVSKGNYTPAEIDKMVLQAKDYFVTMLVSMAIFGYLVIGVIVTLLGSVALSRKN